MGKQTNGIFGAWRGRVGTLVGSSVYGTPTIRTYVETINDKKSSAQLAQRAKFNACRALACLVNNTISTPLISPFVKKMSGYNGFMKYNVSAYSSAGALDFHKLIIASGKLIAPSISACNPGTVDVNGSVSFNQVTDPFALDTDKLYLLVLDDSVDEKGNKTILFAGDTGVSRVDSIANPVEFTNSAVPVGGSYIYAAYMRADGTMVSDTAKLIMP